MPETLTRGGGFFARQSFDAAPLTTTAALVAALPANTTAAVHTIAADLLQPDAVYTLAVTAANFLGRTSAPVRLTVRKFADSLPQVRSTASSVSSSCCVSRRIRSAGSPSPDAASWLNSLRAVGALIDWLHCSHLAQMPVCRHQRCNTIMLLVATLQLTPFSSQTCKQVTVLGGRERSVTSAHDTVLQGVVSLQPPTVWHVASGLCVPNDGSVAPTAFDYRYIRSTPPLRSVQLCERWIDLDSLICSLIHLLARCCALFVPVQRTRRRKSPLTACLFPPNHTKQPHIDRSHSSLPT